MSIREISLDGWGKALLEELLLQGAEQVSKAGNGEFVDVTLTFRLTPDPARDLLEVRTSTHAESALVTTLPRPF